MLITIDTEARLLRLTEGGTTREHSLFSGEAFRLLSRQWIALGWNLGHWSTLSWMGRRTAEFQLDGFSRMLSDRGGQRLSRAGPFAARGGGMGPRPSRQSRGRVPGHPSRVLAQAPGATLHRGLRFHRIELFRGHLVE